MKTSAVSLIPEYFCRSLKTDYEKCSVLHFIFFFPRTAGWGKNNRKMALVGQAKGQQHPSHLTNTVSFFPIHFPLFVTRLSRTVPCSKASVKFCCENLRLQRPPLPNGKPQPPLGQAVGALAGQAGGARVPVPTEMSASTWPEPRSGGRAAGRLESCPHPQSCSRHPRVMWEEGL